jgi:cytochrome c553
MLLAIGGSMMVRDAARAADIAYGEYLAAECASCHAPAARADAIPRLGSLSYDYLVGALRAYRDGSRTDPAMQSVARSLSDAEIEALAAYFAGRS